MAIDVAHVCVAAVENESSQVLATVLAILFLIYTGITILLAGLQLYSVSNVPYVAGAMSTHSGDAPLVSVKR